MHFRTYVPLIGREWDKETGLYFYRARYYAPRVGRFIQSDPIGFLGGDANFYRYVLNDPLNLVDPTGLWDIRRYVSWSVSTTMTGGEGNVQYPGGIEQKSHSPLTLVGVSLDIQVGWIPPLTETAYESAIGLGKHIGVGLVKSEPTACGKTEYGALALHIGIGFGSPITFTRYDPVWQGVNLPRDLKTFWTQGGGR